MTEFVKVNSSEDAELAYRVMLAMGYAEGNPPKPTSVGFGIVHGNWFTFFDKTVGDAVEESKPPEPQYVAFDEWIGKQPRGLVTATNLGLL